MSETQFPRIGKRRAFKSLTFILSLWPSGDAPTRKITMLTTGPLDPDFDTARLQRMMRRLKALGFGLNWRALCHPTDGVGGTIKMYRTHDNQIEQ